MKRLWGLLLVGLALAGCAAFTDWKGSKGTSRVASAVERKEPVPARAPFLSEDGKRLTLLNEVLGRQPLIALESGPKAGTRYIRVAGKGIRAPADVDLRCGGKQFTITRSEITEAADRTHVFFPVDKRVAEEALSGPQCSLIVVGDRVPIPGHLLRAVWGEPTKEKKSPGESR